jgi:hypothetical protein
MYCMLGGYRQICIGCRIRTYATNIRGERKFNNTTIPASATYYDSGRVDIERWMGDGKNGVEPLNIMCDGQHPSHSTGIRQSLRSNHW